MEQNHIHENNNHTEIQSSSKQPSYFGRYFRIWAVLFFFAFLSYQWGHFRGEQSILNDEETFLSFSETNVDRVSGDPSLDFSLFWRVWDLVKEKYVDSDTLDVRDMEYGAIQGMLSATGDPYTHFFDPQTSKEFAEDLSGEFEGIGAKLEMKNQLITVVAPLKESPAEKSGMRAGDVIVTVDGENVTEMSLEEAVSKMRGPKDSEVVIGVVREDSPEIKELTIIRDTIHVESVTLETKDDIAIMTISQFGDTTSQEFRLAVSRLKTEQPNGLIIDLRNNPGGRLTAANEMSSMMLPPGKVIVIEENSQGKQKETLSETYNTAFLRDIPTVILINKGSASASEIFAGALSYHRENVTLVGVTSFGKGSVQELIPLPQKTSAKITVAKWLTPGGEHIDQKGITPDVEVPMTEEDYDEGRDVQLDKALEVLQQENASL
jgi:carboxyl-terminal processing protease